MERILREITIGIHQEGQRLDRFLTKYMPLAPKSFIYKMLRKKNIKLNAAKAEGRESLSQGDVVTLYLAEDTIEGFRRGAADGEETKEQKRQASVAKNRRRQRDPGQKIRILSEDEHVLVLFKPVGMLSQKADRNDVSVVEHVKEYLVESGQLSSEDLQTFQPGICNRLDRNTSGLIVAGKTVQGLQWMNALFRHRDLKKYYLAVVWGKVEKPRRLQGYLVKDGSHNTVSISSVPQERAEYIETEYQPLGVGQMDGRPYTLLRVHLITGKSHQIRAHLHSIGHPIAGDGKYGRKDMYHAFKKQFGLDHQLLHAWRLELGSPDYLPQKYHGAEWMAPVPEDFAKICRSLGLKLPAGA